MTSLEQNSVGDVVVTGATGFVGRRFVASQLGRGRKVIALVQDMARCPPAWVDFGCLTVIQTGPLERAAELDKALLGVSHIVHLGGLAHVKHSEPNSFLAANANATRRIVEACQRSGVRNFIHLSSIAAVSDNAADAPITDDVSPHPVGAYGESKLSAENYVTALAEAGAFAVSLRPPLIVGEEAPGNWRMLQRLAMSPVPLPFASVNNRRSYIGVDTLVEMINHLIDHDWASDKSGNYCVANAGVLSLSHVLSLLRQAMGSRGLNVRVPTKLLTGTLGLLGRDRISRSLFGNLVIDAARFRDVFDFSETLSIEDEIAHSGSKYSRRIQADGV